MMLSTSTTKWLMIGQRKLRVFQYTVDQIPPVKTVLMNPDRPDSAVKLTPKSSG